MSEYDLLLDNLTKMCEIVINTINEGTDIPLEKNIHKPKITTHLNDAYLNILKVKDELDKFNESYDRDTRCRLLTKPHWILKTEESIQDIIPDIIREIDLRSMRVLYSYNCGGTSFLLSDPIDKFLKEFE